MLITGANIKGLSEKTEKVVVYGRDGNTFHEIETPVYGSGVFGEFSQLTPFAITTPMSQKLALELHTKLLEDEKYKSLHFTIIPNELHSLYIQTDKELKPPYYKYKNGYRNDTLMTAEELKQDMTDRYFWPDEKLEIVTEEMYMILAKGKRAHLKQLPSQRFAVGPKSMDVSMNQLMRRQLNFPLSITEVNGGIHTVKRKLSIEENRELPIVGWDTEFEWWEDVISIDTLINDTWEIALFLEKTGVDEKEWEWRNREEIISLLEEKLNDPLYREKNNIFARPTNWQFSFFNASPDDPHEGNMEVIYLDSVLGKDKVIHADISIMDGLKINFVKTDGVSDLVQQGNKIFESFTRMIGTNSYTYDMIKNREFGMEIFGKKPVIEGSGGFFKKVTLPSMLHYDLVAYAQQYMPTTMNNKFVTIASHILNKEIDKPSTYDDQTRNNIEKNIAKVVQDVTGTYDEKKLEEILKQGTEYGSFDTALLLFLGSFAQDLIYLKQKLFDASPESVCSTSKKNLARDVFQIDHFQKYKQFPKWDRDLAREYEQLDMSKILGMMMLDDSAAEFTVPKKMCNGLLFYAHPMVTLFEKMLRNDERSREVMNYMDTFAQSNFFNHLGNKYFLSQRDHVEKLIRFDLLYTLEEGYLAPHVLMKGATAEFISDGDKVASEYSSLFSDFSPLNRSGNFILFPEEYAENEEFLERTKRLGMMYAQGKVFNLKRGSFVLHDGVNLHKRGLDVTGKRGHKTVIAQEILNKFYNSLFKEGPTESLVHVAEFFKSLNERTLDRKQLLYMVNSAAKDYYNMSSYAQRMQRVQAMIQFGTLKGEELVYMNTPDGKITAQDFMNISDSTLYGPKYREFFHNVYLGKTTQSGTNLRSGVFGKHIAGLVEYLPRVVGHWEPMEKEDFVHLIRSGDIDKIRELGG